MSTHTSRTSLSSDPEYLLRCIDDMPDELESDDEFDGYLAPDDGPVAVRSGHDIPSLRRSRSLDSLLDAESEGEAVCETPLPGTSPSLSPMQGQHASGSPLSTSPTHAHESTTTSNQVKNNKLNLTSNTCRCKTASCF